MKLPKRLAAAYEADRKAGDAVHIAERRVRNITEQLFTALKDQEKARIHRNTVAHKLLKMRGF